MLLSALCAVLSAPLAAAQPDIQSPENFWKKAASYEADWKRAVDPQQKADLLSKALEYYRKGRERAENWMGREEKKAAGLEYFIRNSEGIARCLGYQDPPGEADALEAYKKIAEKRSDVEGLASEELKSRLLPSVAQAEEKVKRNGVDIILEGFARKVEEWRIKNPERRPEDSKAMEELKTQVWDMIKGKGTEAMYGIVASLDMGPDSPGRELQVHSLLAEKLAGLPKDPIFCNAEGFQMLIEALAKKTHATGAATALREVTQRFDRDVKSRLQEAEWLKIRLNALPRPGNRTDWKPPLPEIDEGEAAKIRGNMPETLEQPQVLQALLAVLSNPDVEPIAKAAALSCMESFRSLSSEAVAAVHAAFSHPDARVRKAAAVVATKVNPAAAEEKHKLVDEMIRWVQYEPERDVELIAEAHAIEQDEHKDLKDLLAKLATASAGGDKDAVAAAKRDLEAKRKELLAGVAARRGNTEDVREAMATALGTLGLIKAIPALIESLDDENKLVRKASYEALRRIVEPVAKNKPWKLEFDPDAPPTPEAKNQEIERMKRNEDRAAGEEEKKAIQAAIREAEARPTRQEQRAAWEQWWKETRGVEVLVTRYYNFIARWTEFLPDELYDGEGFERKMISRGRDMQEQYRNFGSVLQKEFRETTRLFLMDVTDVAARALDPEAAKHTVELLFGWMNPKPPAEDPEARQYLSLQMFVAESLASIVAATKDDATKAKIREIARGHQPAAPEVKAGCCYALGFLPPDQVGTEEVHSLTAALQDADPRVKRAAAFGIGKVGSAASFGDLANQIGTPDTGAAIQVARGIGRVGGRNPTVGDDEERLARLGIRVSGENEKGEPAGMDLRWEVREEVSYALGEIGHRNGLGHLIRARRDLNEPVRYAAGWAVRQIAKKDPARSVSILRKLYQEAMPDREKKDPGRFMDRAGALLCLGEAIPFLSGGEQQEQVGFLLLKLVGQGEQPWRTWDENQACRRAAAEALGAAGVKSASVRDGLLQAMVYDPAAEVRQEAYDALNRLVQGILNRLVVRKIQIRGVEGRPPETHAMRFEKDLPEAERKGFEQDIRRVLAEHWK